MLQEQINCILVRNVLSLHAVWMHTTSEALTLPSWKEQLLGSWVHRLRYLHQWQWNVLFTQDRHLQDEMNTLLLHHFNILSVYMHSMLWKGMKDKGFLIKSFGNCVIWRGPDVNSFCARTGRLIWGTCEHFVLNVKVRDKDIIFKGNTICPCWPCRTSDLSFILF